MANYETYLEYLGHVEDASEEARREELRKAVEKKDEQLRRMDKDHKLEIMDKVRSMQAQQKKTIDELKAGAQSELAAKEEVWREEVKKFNTSLKEKDQAISSMKKDMERVVAEYKSIKEETSRKMAEYETQLKEKDKMVSDLKTKLTQMNLPRQQFEAELNAKDAVIARLKSDLANAKTELTEFNRRLKEKDDIISKLMADLDKSQPKNTAPDSDPKGSLFGFFHRKEEPKNTEPEKEQGKWVVLARNFDNTIPFKKIRVLNKRASGKLDSEIKFMYKSFSGFRVYTKIDFWLMNIHESEKTTYINDCKEVGDRLNEYEFRQQHYFNSYGKNAPDNQVWVYVEAKYYVLLEGTNS